MAFQIIWFILWSVLWSLYFMTDGFVMGCGMLHFTLGKTEAKRRMLVKSIGPVWNGNEVWLVTAAGATFAAFPAMYAVMFSCMYPVVLMLLFSLIVRGVSLEFRGKPQPAALKKIWDAGIFMGGFLPAFFFGVVFGNIFSGLPLDAAGYHGTLGSLLRPFALLTGALFVGLFSMHGAIYTAIKNEGELGALAEKTAKRLWPFLLGVAALFLIVSRWATGLFDNYSRAPLLFAVPFTAVAALTAMRYFLAKRQWGRSFVASCGCIVMVVLTGVIGLFPNLIPSRTDRSYSLTIFNASSGPYTLRIMTIVAFIFVPMVIAYKIWVYRIFRGKITEDEVMVSEEAY
jgi:cytochrome d ubiquinol oxidase subunit II